MAKNENDIRSTEKLLALIRNPDSATTPVRASDNPAGPKKSKNPVFTPRVSFKKKPTVGIDIGHTHIKLAKVILSEKQYVLVDYLDIPFNNSISLDDPSFLKTLKAALDRFCKSRSSCSLWGAIQSANVEIRAIQIPKLPRKQIPNAIFWSFSKKVSFDPRRELLDYEILGDVTVGGITKTEVITFKAPQADVDAFKAAFKAVGYPLNGISIVPFAIQNLFRRQIIPHTDHNCCCLFVGRDWSRIAIYNKGNLVLSRGIKAGMRSMIEAINVAMQATDNWHEPQLEKNAADAGIREYVAPSIDPRAQQVFFKFIGQPDSIANQPSEDSELDPATVFQMALPALERLIRQVERTFEHFALNYNNEGVSRVYISGQVIANSTLVDHFGKQLDLPVIPMNPFPAESHFVRDIRIPQSVSEKEAYVPAIGLALSDNAITPNFLYTHEDKDKTESIRLNNMRILTVCMLLLMIMIGLFSWQQKQLDHKRENIAKLDQRLIAFSPPAEKEVMLALFAKTKRQRLSVVQMVRRYAPLALLAELSSITPTHIRLLDVSMVLESGSTEHSDQKPGGVVIEGIIFGEPSFFETALTSYLLRLKNSPVFKKPNVQSKLIEYYDEQEVMRFTTRLEVF